jgi:hypothetical protein
MAPPPDPASIESQIYDELVEFGSSLTFQGLFDANFEHVPATIDEPRSNWAKDSNTLSISRPKRWVYDQHLAWWHGSDSSSPNWLSRVLARFPDQAQNALIKMIWLEQAKQRALSRRGSLQNCAGSWVVLTNSSRTL